MQEKRIITRLSDKSEAPMGVLDRTEVTAGQTASLTVTLRERDARRLCVVGIVSTLRAHTYMWPLAVIIR